jgi:hypothetical protein
MNRVAASTWAEIRTAYASGIGLRELARNMGIPAGTVLARSKREGWTQQIATAKLMQRPELARELAKPDAINAITPLQSAELTMQQRGERYADRLGTVVERVVPHLESLPPNEILDNARNLVQFDRVARRNFGLDDQQQPGSQFSINVLANHAAVQFIEGSKTTVSPEK